MYFPPVYSQFKYFPVFIPMWVSKQTHDRGDRGIFTFYKGSRKPRASK